MPPVRTAIGATKKGGFTAYYTKSIVPEGCTKVQYFLLYFQPAQCPEHGIVSMQPYTKADRPTVGIVGLCYQPGFDSFRKVGSGVYHVILSHVIYLSREQSFLESIQCCLIALLPYCLVALLHRGLAIFITDFNFHSTTIWAVP